MVHKKYQSSLKNKVQVQQYSKESSTHLNPFHYSIKQFTTNNQCYDSLSPTSSRTPNPNPLQVIHWDKYIPIPACEYIRHINNGVTCKPKLHWQRMTDTPTWAEFNINYSCRQLFSPHSPPLARTTIGFVISRRDHKSLYVSSYIKFIYFKIIQHFTTFQLQNIPHDVSKKIEKLIEKLT